MSKVITRRIIRVVQTTIQSAPTTIGANNSSIHPMNARLTSVATQARYIAISSMNAIADAGFGNINVRRDNNLIHISGNNRGGEILVAELTLDNKGGVASMRTDTLNVKECDKVEELFNKSLQSHGIQYEITDVYDSACNSKKPPIPLSNKVEQNRRMLNAGNGRLRN